MKEIEKTPIERGREVRQARVKLGLSKRRSPIQVSKEKPNSMRCAINANCYECVGRSVWVEKVRNCSNKECFFHSVRPHINRGLMQKGE